MAREVSLLALRDWPLAGNVVADRTLEDLLQPLFDGRQLLQLLLDFRWDDILLRLVLLLRLESCCPGILGGHVGGTPVLISLETKAVLIKTTTTRYEIVEGI